MFISCQRKKYLLPVENDISRNCKQIDIDTFCPKQALILLMLLFVDTFVLRQFFSCFFECQRAQKEGSSKNDNGRFRVDKIELLKSIFSPIFIDIILVKTIYEATLHDYLHIYCDMIIQIKLFSISIISVFLPE